MVLMTETMALTKKSMVLFIQNNDTFNPSTPHPQTMIIKSYPKSELAQMYFPDSPQHTATNHLTAWIRRCPALSEALLYCHQSPRAKFYSAQAVRLIVEYLGEP